MIREQIKDKLLFECLNRLMKIIQDITEVQSVIKILNFYLKDTEFDDLDYYFSLCFESFLYVKLFLLNYLLVDGTLISQYKENSCILFS